MSNKRLELLQKMTATDNADSFTWYGLAMEYRRLDRLADALTTFESLRQKDAQYLPTYLMAAQVLVAQGEASAASEWLEQGIELAKSTGDQKTLDELETLLSETRS